MNIDKMYQGYVECAIWASKDAQDRPLDSMYGAMDLSVEAAAKMREDCADFVHYCQHDARLIAALEADWTSEQAGHDFWLSRNGHGAGFFDRGNPGDDDLQAAAKTFGSCDLVIGDDGLIYCE